MKTKLLSAALCAFLAMPLLLQAQSVPALINYQGQIQNPDGTAPPTADYTLTFRIYDTASGGSVIWGPQIFDGVGGAGHGPKIPVVQGYFNVMLGPTDTTSRSLANAFDASSRFIEITVSNRPPVAPRQQLLSGPFALRAGNSDKLAGYDWGSLLSVNDPVNGLIDGAKLTPGTITPSNLSQQLVLDSLIPPGTIVAYSGTNPPPGWFLCDGQQASRTTNSRLFAVIATAWGQGNGATTFHLPDLRGVFLRGVNGNRNDSYADPEPIGPVRTNAFTGGNTGNAVGSYQLDAFQNHGHTLSWSHGFGPSPGGGVIGHLFDLPGGGTSTSAVGGSETRPKNAYVNYIIKY